MKSFFINIFLIFAVLSANAFAADKKTSTGEAYLDKFLKTTQTLEANFQQTLRTHDGEVLQQTEGKFYLNRPGKFRWNYQSPYEQVIVSDGVRIWIYDVDLQQVTVQKQSESLPPTPMALLDDSSKLYQSFDVSPLDEHDGIYRLKLQSKTKESDFAEIVVGLDATGLRFMQLHDQFKQVTDIVFSNISTNTRLAKEIFQFVPPEGVDVFGG
ncbi:MAG: outer membrane lipoprotein chaperone LolA [Gammaproteobacteria bacterium]|jgi:outer membrane lipoprotein carrier protein|nr:outer membrane lipoprotein chaperone LolA [Gammaproteobacteria bacterium]